MTLHERIERALGESADTFITPPSELEAIIVRGRELQRLVGARIDPRRRIAAATTGQAHQSVDDLVVEQEDRHVARRADLQPEAFATRDRVVGADNAHFIERPPAAITGAALPRLNHVEWGDQVIAICADRERRRCAARFRRRQRCARRIG